MDPPESVPRPPQLDELEAPQTAWEPEGKPFQNSMHSLAITQCLKNDSLNICAVVGTAACSHHTIGLYVSRQGVYAKAHALLHDVNVAPQLSSVVGVTHVSAMIVPARPLPSKLEQRVIFANAEEFWKYKFVKD